MTATGPVFVVDANVLIDYVEADPSMLALMARCVGPIHVPRRVLRGILRWGESDCEAHGLSVVTEEMDELTAAAAPLAGLSFPDRLVMAVAIRRTWSVVTNDGRMRTALESKNVPRRWGLDVMLDLVRGGHLPRLHAIGVAERICASNRTLRPSVLSEFRKKAAPRGK